MILLIILLLLFVEGAIEILFGLVVFLGAFWLILAVVIFAIAAFNSQETIQYTEPATVIVEEKPKKTQYVTQVLGTRIVGNVRELIEKRITLEQCVALPGYRGVVYGICDVWVP